MLLTANGMPAKDDERRYDLVENYTLSVFVRAGSGQGASQAQYNNPSRLLL